MVHRKALIAAALAALTTGGLVRATDAVPAAGEPVYLQEAEVAVEVDPAAAAAAEEEAARKPLMALMDAIGLAEGLDDAGITLGGWAEAGWTKNFEDPESGVNFGRVFDFEDEDPNLHQVAVFAEKTVTADGDTFDVGFRVEAMYGADARGIHSLGLFDHYGFYNVPSTDDADSPDNQFDLTQAYVDVALPVGSGLNLRVGKFVTLLGYEVINPTGNLFYSRSYLFGYAIPFTHTGVLATYKLHEKVSASAGVTRGWDTSLEDDNDTLDFLGQVAVALDEETKFYLNVVTGPDQPGNNDSWRSVVDVILSRAVGENLTVAVNGDYGYEADSDFSVSGSDAQWYGLAAYASYKLIDQVSVNVRGEYFNDEDGARLSGGVGGAEFMEATVGLSITPFAGDDLMQNLVFRPEVRYDYSDEAVFGDGDSYDQVTFGVDAYFTF